jgi:hypothetical protein
MLIVLRGLLSGTAIGVVFGALARVLMRLVAIGMGNEPEFDLSASLAIVSLFAISGAGAGAAGAVGLRSWGLALAVVLTSAPLLVTGAAFALGEIGEILDHDLTLPWLVELLALSGVIVATMLLTPYAGWRAGRRAAGRLR